MYPPLPAWHRPTRHLLLGLLNPDFQEVHKLRLGHIQYEAAPVLTPWVLAGGRLREHELLLYVRYGRLTLQANKRT